MMTKVKEEKVEKRTKITTNKLRFETNINEIDLSLVHIVCKRERRRKRREK